LRKEAKAMSEESKGINYTRLALGAGLLAAAAVSIAVFVPRRHLALVTEPLAGIAKLYQRGFIAGYFFPCQPVIRVGNGTAIHQEMV